MGQIAVRHSLALWDQRPHSWFAWRHGQAWTTQLYFCSILFPQISLCYLWCGLEIPGRGSTSQQSLKWSLETGVGTQCADLICSVLSKSQRIGTNIMYWEDFPEAVNNVPEAEEKLQIDPNLALMTVVPKYWTSVLKYKGSFKPPFTFQNYRGGKCTSPTAMLSWPTAFH